MFKEEKKQRLADLYLPDKSPIGNVDERIKSLLDSINEIEDYYTMSSCSGRTTLSKVKDSGKGLDWLFVSHDIVHFKDIEKIISNLPGGLVYFRYEGLILHTCAKDLESAQRLMLLGQNNGCKYSSIISTKKRFVVEFIDMIRMDVPIAKDGKLLVDVDYLKFLIDEANKKLSLTHALIDRLELVIN